MRTTLTKFNNNANDAHTIIVELVEFSRGAYEVRKIYKYSNAKDKTIPITSTPNVYHAKIFYGKEVDSVKCDGYITESKED